MLSMDPVRPHDTFLRDGMTWMSSIIISPNAQSKWSSTARSVRGARRCSSLMPMQRRPPVFCAKRNRISLPMFEKALRRGIQVETHAIGDRANRIILDLYEQAFRKVHDDPNAAANPHELQLNFATPVGASNMRRFSAQRISRASRNSASFRRCNRHMRSAICFSRRAGSGKSVSPERTPGRA